MQNMQVSAFEKKFMLDGLSGKYLIVGFSGGADSTSLLHFLAGKQQLLGCRLCAVHLNHCLRGEESDRDEAAAKAFCISLGVPFVSRRVEIGVLAARSHQSEEVCGREERYRLFAQQALQARQQGMEPVIVTAHTLSDNLETALLHLLRGCTLDGLCGIPDRRLVGDLPLVRPMLRISREEVEGYCSFYQLPFTTDSSNLSDRYTRNFLRLQVIPQLKKLNPSVETAYLRMRDSLRQDRDYLNSLRDDLLRQASAGTPDAPRWNTALLSGAPMPVKSRAAAEILRVVGAQVDTASVEALTGVIDGRSSGYLAGGIRFSVRGGMLLAEDTHRFAVGEGFLPEGGEGRVAIPFEEWDGDGHLLDSWEKSMLLAVFPADEWQEKRKVYKNLLYFAVDYDTIKDNVRLRTRGPGDSIRLPGRGGRKTLKKLFQQAHLSRRERALRIVLAQGPEVIWVEGFGTDERFLPGPNTIKVLVAFQDETAAKERMKSEDEPQDDR